MWAVDDFYFDSKEYVRSRASCLLTYFQPTSLQILSVFDYWLLICIIARSSLSLR